MSVSLTTFMALQDFSCFLLASYQTFSLKNLVLIRLNTRSAPLGARARAALQAPLQNAPGLQPHPRHSQGTRVLHLRVFKQCVRGSSRRWPPPMEPHPRRSPLSGVESGDWSGRSVQKARALSLRGAPFHPPLFSSLKDQALTRQTGSRMLLHLLF